MERIKTYKEFWPFYLQQHSNKMNRNLHFLGTSIGFALLIKFARTLDWKWFAIGILSGYTCAWIGHFAIEKNKPATLKYPIWSFISDWKMWFYILIGKLE